MVGWEPFLYSWGAVQQNITRGITETVTVSEQHARVKGSARLTSQSVGVGESQPEVPRRKTQRRSFAETLPYPAAEPVSYIDLSFTPDSYTISYEVIARVKGIVRAVSQSTTIAEATSREKSGSKAIGIEVDEPTIVVSDLVQRTDAKFRVYAESATPLASFEDLSFIAASYETLSRAIIDTVTFEKPVGIAKTVTQTVTISEQVARLETKLRAVIDIKSITEALDNLIAKTRALTEDIPEPEEILTSEVESSAIRHTKSLIEDETISEDILSQAEKARTIDETETITDRLQGWAKGIPLQEEPEPIPDITNIIGGVRETRIRFPERRGPRFEYEVENTVYAPLKLLPFASDIHKILSEIRPRDIPNTALIPSLRVRSSNRGQASTPIQIQPRLNSIRLPLRLPQEPKILASKLRLLGVPTQQALEPRKIINIERKYRTLKAYLLLHMIESLD
jgi:hypothetical protein